MVKTIIAEPRAARCPPYINSPYNKAIYLDIVA